MILGISLDGTCARGVLTDAEASVIGRAEATQVDATSAVAAVAQSLAGGERARIQAAGVSFPDPNPATWLSDLSFVSATVGQEIATKSLSTGNAAALAEAWYGAGKGARHLVALSVGQSVSAGVISNGTLLTGAHGCASSVQWLALNPVEREDYRRMGCLEAEGGSSGIVRRLIWRIKSGDESRVFEAAGSNYSAITLDAILEAARANDGVSISVIRDTVKYLAMAVTNIATVVDPEVIVLGGVLESASDLLFDALCQECARRMPPSMAGRVRLEISTLGPDAAAMGAARFARSGAGVP